MEPCERLEPPSDRARPGRKRAPQHLLSLQNSIRPRRRVMLVNEAQKPGRSIVAASPALRSVDRDAKSLRVFAQPENDAVIF